MVKISYIIFFFQLMYLNEQNLFVFFKENFKIKSAISFISDVKEKYVFLENKKLEM